jgi:hypothetical protein
MLSQKIKTYLSNNEITENHFGWDIQVHNIVIENNGDGDTIVKWDSDAVGIAQPTQEELDAL